MAPPRPIGFWLKLVDRLIDDQFDSVLTAHGVTRRQWQVVNLLSRSEATERELSVDLAPFVQAPHSEPLAGVLAELVGSGWVAQVGEVYQLTEDGRTSMSGLAVVVGELRTALAEGITDEEYAQTLSVLERMARNLGWSAPASAR